MGDYDLAEKMFLKGIERSPYRPVFYEHLAELYDLQGRTEKSEEFSRKGKRVRQQMEGLPLVTANNYNDIANKVFAKKIPLICMQYPRRDIQILKDMFWVKHPIIFVENKTNFEEALMREQYSEYFSDSFGSNFGHGTRKGNYLIAENLSNTIISQVLPAARAE